MGIDARTIVKRFGGRMELYRRLTAIGHPISVKTIEKWMERDSIPTQRLIVLMKLANKEGRTLNLQDYIIKTDNELHDQQDDGRTSTDRY
jgi:hypothetical protein